MGMIEIVFMISVEVVLVAVCGFAIFTLGYMATCLTYFVWTNNGAAIKERIASGVLAVVAWCLVAVFSCMATRHLCELAVSIWECGRG